MLFDDSVKREKAVTKEKRKGSTDFMSKTVEHIDFLRVKQEIVEIWSHLCGG